MKSFFDLINKRESCRNYANTKVEKEKLLACIDAARIAPSACNSQPWSFIVVNNEDTSLQLAQCLQESGMNKFTNKCPSFIVVVEEKASLLPRIAGAVKSQTYAPIDIGIATTHICLSATEQGLSTCIIGWFNESKLKKLLNIEKSKRIRLVVCVGYSADDKTRNKVRKNIGEIARFID